MHARLGKEPGRPTFSESATSMWNTPEPRPLSEAKHSRDTTVLPSVRRLEGVMLILFACFPWHFGPFLGHFSPFRVLHKNSHLLK